MAADWLKIRNDYINGGGSYRKLAEKYEVSFPTLRDRAKKEKWADAKEKQRDKIISVTSQKTAELVATTEANRIAKILAMSDHLGEQLARAIDELDRQMVKNKVKTRVIEYNAKKAAGRPSKETIHEEEHIEVVSGCIDRLGLQQISAALKNIKDIVYTLPALDVGEGQKQSQAALLEAIKGATDED